MTPNDYTLDDLVRLTGFTKRQIRFYITKRLVSGAGDRGPNAGYGEDTLRRLRLIAAMKDIPIAPSDRTMTLDEIGHALDTLPEDGITSLLEGRAELALIDTDDTRPRFAADSHEARFNKSAPPPDSAREFLARMRGPDGIVRQSSGMVAASREIDLPFDSLNSAPLLRERIDSLIGGEETDSLYDLLGRLQATLAELGSDTRFTNTAQDGEQWLRINTPDVEFHVRKPDDHKARQRLLSLAQTLGRLLAREE